MPRAKKSDAQAAMTTAPAAPVSTPKPTVIESPNMRLWDSLSVTDPAYTKPINGKRFNGTSINVAYIQRRLTEAFGPCGIGWQFVIDKQWFQDGHYLAVDEQPTPDALVNHVVIHIVMGHIDYRLLTPEQLASRDNEALSIIPWHSTSHQFGQTTFVGADKNGPFTDEDAPKKSASDCLGKCAVALGIGADIHMGEFDDKYTETDGTPAKPTGKKRAPAGAKAPAVVAAVMTERGATPETWNAAQWQELLGNYDAAKVLEAFKRAIANKAIYENIANWPGVCNAFGCRAQIVCTMDSPERAELTALLLKERGRIDAFPQS